MTLSIKKLGTMVAVIATLAALSGSGLSLFAGRVLAENQIHTHTNQIAELKQTDDNFAKYMNLMQTQIAVSDAKYSVLEKKVDEVGDDVKQLLQRKP